MSDIRLQKLANLLVNYSVKVKPGWKTHLIGYSSAEPLLKEIYKETLKAGGIPTVRIKLDEDEYLMLKYGSPEQYEKLDEYALNDMKTLDARIIVLSDRNTKSMSGIDPKKISARQKANMEIFKVMDDRFEKGELHWVGTLYPTYAYSMDSKMSFEEYSEFVFEAMALNKENPIAHWEEVSRKQEKIVETLNKVEKIRYVGDDTDITFAVKGRKWINCDGRLNFPDGEVFTSPIEDAVDGHIRFDMPAVVRGREAENIFLRLEKGRVVEAKAEKGDDFLQAMLDTDEGARGIGEVAIGTNYQIQHFSRNILFDEKIGGTVHMAVGMSYRETGGKNVSAIHWDMIKDMKNGGKIYADGKLIYENGKFIE